MKFKNIVLFVCILSLASPLSTVLIQPASATFQPTTYEVLAAPAPAPEVSIAMNPTNNNNLVIAHNYLSQGTFIQYSTDGGYTWVPGQDPSNYIKVDPFLAFDSQGNLYYSFMEWHNPYTVAVAKSEDGGASFAQPKTIAQVGTQVVFKSGETGRLAQKDWSGNPLTAPVDYPKIACDTSGSEYTDSVYVTFAADVDTNGDGNQDWVGQVFAYSRNGGEVWSPLLAISNVSPNETNFAINTEAIGIGADGKIYIVLRYAEDQSIYVIRSEDGGRSFLDPHLAIPKDPIFLTTFGGMAAASPSQANLVYMTFVARLWESNSTYDPDIFVSNSTDYGETWSTPLRVNDDPINNGAMQRNLFLSVAPNGRLDIAWFDHRFDITSLVNGDVFYSYSTDEGANFAPNIRLTPSTTLLDVHGNDYLTIVSLDNKAIVAYAYPTPPDDRLEQMDAYVNHITFLSLPVHNVVTGLDYATIQEAIDALETRDGHTIRVDAGTYYENVVVDKSLIIIGEDPSTTIIDGGGGGTFGEDVVTINSENATISGFTIQNGRYGIYPYLSLYPCTISGNIILNNFVGISIEEYSENHIISNNTVTNNMIGIYMSQSSGNTIDGNILSNNGEGVTILGSDGNTVSDNIVSNNGGSGIGLWSSSGNTINNNTVSNNTYGIYIKYIGSNTISGNTLSNNDYGVYLDTSSNNNAIYHNNFIDNVNQAASPGGTNVWDDGYPYGGNYWSDYNGTDLYSGPYQNETGSDGIGDDPYVIDVDNTDNYPLMNPWGAQAPTMHVESIDFKKKGPKLHIKVTIYDDTGSPVSGATVYMNITYPDQNVYPETAVTDAEGIATHMIQNPAQGTYTVTVTNVTHDTLTYNPADNVETSDSYTV